MNDIVTTTAAQRSVTALFDTKPMAESAQRDLIDAGFQPSSITIVAGATENVAETAVPQDKSFWDSLKDLFLPDEDRSAYAEGLRRGGYLLTVRCDHALYEHALHILDRDGAVDIGERETAWRAEGWQAYQPGAAEVATAAAARGSVTGASAGEVLRPATGEDRVEKLDAGREDVISLTEERLDIGKRDVSHGKVRLRSYVIETPVNETVDLRSESIEVNRRPVDRPVTAQDADFQDRVIEAEEYREEAVVAKTARVTEEVSLRKTADSRTETVSDSVRRTEVEVDDSRGHGLAAAKTSSIVAHMDVIASDGQKVGTVDHLEGADKIKLTKTSSSDGQHHFIPMAWVDHVDRHVHLNKPRVQVQSGW
jgi:uncharacterized protein (TIGR02271 family)